VRLLVGDIGGTTSRLALVESDGALTALARFNNCEFNSPDDVLSAFSEQHGPLPRKAVLAVAGPVHANEVTMTNLGWQLSGKRLVAQHGFHHVELMNDFAAQAWATLALEPGELHSVGGGKAQATGNRGVLGPGTGLGVGGLVSAGDDWAVIAGEGGHVTLAGVTPEEQALIDTVVGEYGHCSAERLLSGPGLVTICQHLGGAAAEPAAVTQLARDGNAEALQAINLFAALLGMVAADLALTLGARGGIYLAGGILPAMLGVFPEQEFRQRFEAKGRFKDYLAAIPTCIITTPDPSLRGLAAYGARHL